MNSQDASHRSLTLTSYILIHPLTSTAVNTSGPDTDTIRQYNFYRQITHNAYRPTYKNLILCTTQKTPNIQAPYKPFHNKTLQHPKKNSKATKPLLYRSLVLLFTVQPHDATPHNVVMSVIECGRII